MNRHAGLSSDRQSLLRRMLQRAEVDLAVFFSLLLRSWQLLGGALSVLLIGSYFTQELQGYYYTFASLMALQTVFDLGFSIVVRSVTSHEWAQLHVDTTGTIRGNTTALSRLVSLGRLLFRWYAVVSLLFIVSVGTVGGMFITHNRNHAIAWHGPWLALVILSGLFLWTLPFVALLEGCGQVATVYRFRLTQAVVASLAVWSSILLGGGLWTAAIATGARLVSDLYLLLIRYRMFFRAFWTLPTRGHIHWYAELWPMQWRLAVGGLLGYFAFSLFTPVMFYYQGAVVAGQMGMTWTLISALQAAALAWVETRVPRFGMLISQGAREELDRVFKRLMLISLGVIVVTSTALWWLIYLLNVWQFSLAHRFLPPAPTAIFLMAVIVYQIPHCQTFYLRAHKREPLLVLNAIAYTIIGLLVWILGSHHGPLGAAIGYLAVVMLFVLPYETVIWERCHRTGYRATPTPRQQARPM